MRRGDRQMDGHVQRNMLSTLTEGTAGPRRPGRPPGQARVRREQTAAFLRTSLALL